MNAKELKKFIGQQAHLMRHLHGVDDATAKRWNEAEQAVNELVIEEMDMTVATIVLGQEQLKKIIESHYKAQGMPVIDVTINVGMTFLDERRGNTQPTFKNAEVKVELVK